MNRLLLCTLLCFSAVAVLGQDADAPKSILDDPAALFDPKIQEAAAWKVARERAAEQAKIKRQQALGAKPAKEKAAVSTPDTSQSNAKTPTTPVERKSRNKPYRPNPMAVWQAQWMQRQMAMIRTPYTFIPPRR